MPVGRRALVQIALVVRDYDEAIEWFRDRLEFELLEDTRLSATKRWVVMRPGGSPGAGCRILLARAATPEQERAIGNQTGGRVFLFMHTDDLDRDVADLRARGVTFAREPSRESFGKVAVFRDLYGNLWDLIEPLEA